MMLRYSFLLAMLAIWVFPSVLVAQSPPGTHAASGAEDGAYCNVFYIQSNNLDRLPLMDVCFVADEYSVDDAQHLRCVGPIEGPIDLFRAYPWAMHFYLPEVKEGDRLKAILPSDLSAGDWDMEPGQFAITISDNRKFDRFADVKDQVSMVAVDGYGRLTGYTPKTGDMKYPEYELQLDLKMKEVENLEGKDTPVGKEFRLRMVLRVEALD